jgi:thiol-disulfide isomerase/thioredoxin
MRVIRYWATKKEPASLAFGFACWALGIGSGLLMAAAAQGSPTNANLDTTVNQVTVKASTVKADTVKSDGVKSDILKAESLKSGPLRSGALRSGALRSGALKPGTAKSVNDLLVDGQNQMLRGQYKSASTSLEKLVKDYPSSAEGHLLLGQSYCKLKNYDKAREHLRLAIRTGAGGPSAQKANLALMSLPKHLIAPKSGPQTRLIASMLGLGRSRGGEAKPTVIDFYAPWCQPCKQLGTAITRAKMAYGDKINFMTVNVDDPGSQTIMDQYDISPIPTMVFLNPDGEVITYAVGFSGDGSVNDGIKKILPKVN